MLLVVLAMSLQVHEAIHHARRMVVAVNKGSLDEYLSGDSRRLSLETRAIKGDKLCIFKDMISRSPSTVYAVEFEGERKMAQPGYVGEQDLTQIPLHKLGPYVKIAMPFSATELKRISKGRRFRISTSFVDCGTSDLTEVVTPWYASR